MAGGSDGRSVMSRGLGILECFDAAHPRMSLSEIARRSQLPLATAHRLVAELERRRALHRAEDGSYEIGALLWDLGLLSPMHRELREVAAPVLVDLYERSRDNVHLAVREGMHALYVERVIGRRSFPLMNRSGARLPLHATGVGKVLLAHAPTAITAAVMDDLTAHTPSTITDPRRLTAELADVRRRGYATTEGEMTVGASSAAVPVLTSAGVVAASVGLVTTRGRGRALACVPLLRAAAAAIAEGLPQGEGDDHRYVDDPDLG